MKYLRDYLRQTPLDSQVKTIGLAFTIGCIIFISSSVLIWKLSRIDTVIADRSLHHVELINQLPLEDRTTLAVFIDGLRKLDPGISSMTISSPEGEVLASLVHSESAGSRLKVTDHSLVQSKGEVGKIHVLWDLSFFTRVAFASWAKITGLLAFSVAALSMLSGYVIRGRIKESVAELEQAHLEVEAAEAAAKSKMDFLSNMSHEIRSPLGAMMGFAQLLETAKLSKDERNYLNSINISGEFVLRILNDILDLSKIEASGIELEMAPFQLIQLTKDVEQMMLSEAQFKQIEIISECSGLSNQAVVGDKHRLKQVLMNLVGNAIKFTRKGSVTIRIAAECDAADSKATVLFEVIDTGIGMSNEQLEKIFIPFSQAEACVSRKFGGTGLGLSIAQKLVATMGGQIKATSQEAVGSTFSFELSLETAEPVKAVSCDKSVSQEAQTQSKQDLRILVAEDESVNRTLISKFFDALGYPVEFAIDGQDCIDQLNGEEGFDAIFLDLHMPHHNGMEIARRIKEGEFGKENLSAKLTIMSADVLADERGKEIGVDSFVSKPINIAELKNCLDSIVPPKKESRKLKALVVEDQALNRQMIGQIFASFGMEPNFANDGVECIEFLEDHPDLDLILLDLRMPRMDGWTVARKIRSGEAGELFAQIPIAVVSAEIQSEETCREIGVNEFIAKPFNVSQIRDFVTKVGEETGVELTR